MSHFTLISSGIDVSRLVRQLDDHPEVWNTRPERRTGNSPHRETSDIWYRFATPEAMTEPGFPERPHTSVWWPAARVTPAVMTITDDVWNLLESGGDKYRLGGVLATKIPPGCQVYEHDDDVAWHARYYDMKVWIPLKANDRCVNTVEDEAMVWRVGEGWHHNNLIRHSVRNEGESERIVLVLCFRKE